MRYNQKRAIKCSKRAQLWIFTPHFSKFRAFRMWHPPKWHWVLEFLAEKKAFHFLKRALRAGTARNKWLKKALLKMSWITWKLTLKSKVLVLMETRNYYLFLQLYLLRQDFSLLEIRNILASNCSKPCKLCISWLKNFILVSLFSWVM